MEAKQSCTEYHTLCETVKITFLSGLSHVRNPLLSINCSPKYQTSRRPMVLATWRYKQREKSGNMVTKSQISLFLSFTNIWGRKTVSRTPNICVNSINTLFFPVCCWSKKCIIFDTWNVWKHIYWSIHAISHFYFTKKTHCHTINSIPQAVDIHFIYLLQSVRPLFLFYYSCLTWFGCR